MIRIIVASISLICPPTWAMSAVDNPIQRELIDAGIVDDGTSVKLSRPVLADSASAADERKVLAEVAGGESAVDAFLRDSVTTPIIIRTSDVKAAHSTFRVATIYFTLHADLADLKLDDIIHRGGEKTVEAGNMRLTTRGLTDLEIRGRSTRPADAPEGLEEAYTRQDARLLDRIAFSTTDRTVVTRSDRSIVIASKTSHQFDDDPKLANRWHSIKKLGSAETAGPEAPYLGGGSYLKVTNLQGTPGVLFVESHLTFVEPTGWFDGNPILRSKVPLICQDQVRQLRREIAKRKPPK